MRNKPSSSSSSFLLSSFSVFLLLLWLLLMVTTVYPLLPSPVPPVPSTSIKCTNSTIPISDVGGCWISIRLQLASGRVKDSFHLSRCSFVHGFLNLSNSKWWNVEPGRGMYFVQKKSSRRGFRVRTLLMLLLGFGLKNNACCSAGLWVIVLCQDWDTRWADTRRV